MPASDAVYLGDFVDWPAVGRRVALDDGGSVARQVTLDGVSVEHDLSHVLVACRASTC